jgi:hypothetical protein
MGATLGARSVDFGFYLVSARDRLTEGVQLRKRLTETRSGFGALQRSPLFEEVHEILDLGLSIRRQTL